MRITYITHQIHQVIGIYYNTSLVPDRILIHLGFAFSPITYVDYIITCINRITTFQGIAKFKHLFPPH